MPLDPKAQGRFEDICRYARDAIRFVGGKDLAEFAADDQCHLAVQRCLEIIGEARALPRDVRDRFAQIPWPMMIAMRHILTHEYGRVRLSVVHQTVLEDLPLLIEQVQEILQAEPRKVD